MCLLLSLIIFLPLVDPLKSGDGVTATSVAPAYYPSASQGGMSASDPPLVVWDEQLGLTLTQSFTSLAFDVAAVPQQDVDGYGPAYLLNGLSNTGYWYQVGLSYNWPATTLFGFLGVITYGFHLNYEVFNPSGNSIFPSSGGGIASFSGAINPYDTVLLSLSFSGGNVVMYGRDLNTGSIAQESFSAEGSSSFVGTASHGFFTGLMTEWWHVKPYYGNEAFVVYNSPTFALASATMWMDEWDPSNGTSLFYVSSLANYNGHELQFFPSHGTIEVSNAFGFATGTSTNLVQMSFTNSVLGGGSGYAPPILSYSYNGAQYPATLGGSVLTIYTDQGTYWSTTTLLAGSSPTERWGTNQPVSGTASSPGTISLAYFHQFFVAFNHQIIGGGTGYSTPIITYMSFGSAATANSGSSQWIDAGSSYSYPTLLTGPLAAERWYAPSSAGTVSSPATVSITYYHQFYLSVTGASVSSQWYNSGATVSISVQGVYGRSASQGFRVSSYSQDGGGPTQVFPTTGTITVSIVMNSPHSLTISSVIQYQVNLDTGATSALNSITPPTISGDKYWYDSGSPVEVILGGAWGRSSGQGNRLTSFSVNGAAATSVATTRAVAALSIRSITSPQTLTTTITTQFLLTTPSGSIVSVTPPSISGDPGWYDSGTTVQVVYNYVWNVTEGLSRTTAVSFLIDASSTNLPRSASGTFTVSVVAARPLTINVVPVLQYHLTISGGTNITTSTKSPTNDDWYDSGSTLTLSTPYTWNIEAGKSRQNLVSYAFDGIVDNVTREESGTFTTPAITFIGPHSVAFNSIVQYVISFEFKDNAGASTIIPSSVEIDISGSGVKTVELARIWIDNGSRFKITSVIWENVEVKPTNPLTYQAIGPTVLAIDARVYDATIKVRDYLGIPVSGAHAEIKLANGSVLASTSGSDGTIAFGLIPLGTYRGSVSNLGVPTQIEGDASIQSVSVATVPLSSPSLLIFVGVFAFLLIAVSRRIRGGIGRYAKLAWKYFHRARFPDGRL